MKFILQLKIYKKQLVKGVFGMDASLCWHDKEGMPGGGSNPGVTVMDSCVASLLAKTVITTSYAAYPAFCRGWD